MRITRASWGLLLGAAIAVATTICVVERTGPMTAVAPTRSAFPEFDRAPVHYRPGAPPDAPARPADRPRLRPDLDPFFPDVNRMILYTPPGFRTAPK
jgi:hypothetical protein